jgi:hypothetical protein
VSPSTRGTIAQPCALDGIAQARSPPVRERAAETSRRASRRTPFAEPRNPCLVEAFQIVTVVSADLEGPRA